MPIILLAAMIFMMQFYQLGEKNYNNKADAAKVEPKEDLGTSANGEFDSNSRQRRRQNR